MKPYVACNIKIYAYSYIYLTKNIKKFLSFKNITCINYGWCLLKI